MKAIRGVALFAALAMPSLHAPAALAEPCGEPIVSTASTDLNAVSARECDLFWSDRLQTAGKLATVHVDREASGVTEAFKEKVVEGLQAGDGALGKLGPDAFARRNGPVGRAVRVILTAVSDGESLAWEEMNDVGCFIVVDPGSWTTDEGRDGIPITMAHELFHCVQDAVLPTAVVDAGSGSGDDRIYNDWWLEGSAEWFGIMAQPDQERTDLAAEFEELTDHLALSDFGRSGITSADFVESYSGWPFFAWYSEKHSAHAVLPFLRQLPRKLHTPTDVARELDHAAWGEFATRYSAFTIRMSGVGRIDPDSRDAQPAERIGEGTHTIERPTAHMIRERIDLEPGSWALESTANGDNGDMFVSRVKGDGDPDGSWQGLDQRREIKSVCGEPVELMIAGFGSDPDATPFTYSVERIDDDCEVRPSSRGYSR